MRDIVAQHYSTSHLWLWVLIGLVVVVAIIIVLGLSNPDMRQDRAMDDPDNVMGCLGGIANFFWWLPWW